MKLCTNCKHLYGSSACLAPANGASLVDGKPKPVLVRLARTNNPLSGSPCGPEGTHFEPKSTLKTMMQRIFWRG